MKLSLLTIGLIRGVFAYGDLGHRTVGYVAEKHLSPGAKLLFDHLLANPNNYDYSDAAVWADSQKRRWPWSSAYHYINPVGDNPPAKCKVNITTDCPSKGCIVTAIANYTSIILDTRRPLIDRKNATMFVMHFLGDLHQPLHVAGYKRGGNELEPLCWKRSPPAGKKNCSGDLNLHGVWDTRIVHQLRGVALSLDTPEEKAAAAKWAGELFKKQEVAGQTTSSECADLSSLRCILGWAKESNGLVCESVLKRGEEWILSHDLSKEYFEENAEVVDDLVGKAGLRLAAWLNAISAATGERGDL